MHYEHYEFCNKESEQESENENGLTQNLENEVKRGEIEWAESEESFVRKLWEESEVCKNG